MTGANISSVATLESGGVLAACDGNGRVYFWNVVESKIITSLNDPAVPAVPAGLQPGR